MTIRMPMSARWLAITIGGLMVGLSLMSGPFIVGLTGKVAGFIVLVGGAAFISSYLVLWNDAVNRVAERLKATTLSEGRQQTIQAACHVAISLVSIGCVLLLITFGNGGL